MAGEKIKVICHGCGARYQVRATKVQGRRFRATCKKCGGIIVAHCSNAAGFTVLPAGTGSGGGQEGTPMRLEREELRSYHEEEATWYVVIGGKPHGPLLADQIRQSFEAGRISDRTYLWRAGDPEWRRLGEVPQFMELGAGQTANYEAGDTTGETCAAGPMGIRKQACTTPVEEDLGEQTNFYQGQLPDDSDEGEATKFHVRDDGAPEPVAEQDQMQWDPPQQPKPEQWQMPVIPPRKAVLPAPSGARAPIRQSASLSSPGGSVPEHTRPLSDGERAQVLSNTNTDAAGFNLLPSLAPAADADVPPPPVPTSAFSQSLKPIGPPAGPALLAPAEEPFWTTGKIAAAAAIGGGLAVAMAVVVVVSLVRPRPKPVVARAGVTKKAKRPTPKKTLPIRVKSAKQPKAKPDKKAESKEPTETGPKDKAGDDPPKAAEAKKEAPEKKESPKKLKGKRGGPTRVALRKKSKKRRPKRSRRRRSPSGVGDEVEDLLKGKSRKSASKSKGAVDPDALLAAGTGGTSTPKSKPKGAPSPDDLLATAAPSKKKLTQAKIRTAMRGVRSRVQGCFDKYKVPGQAKVSFVVRPNGKFDARVVGQFAGTPTGYCVLNGVNKATFPAFSGKPVRFTYPFDLK